MAIAMLSSAYSQPDSQSRSGLQMTPALINPQPAPPAQSGSRASSSPIDTSALKEVPVLMSSEGEATLSSQMAGKIKAINFSIGQSFNKGQLLLEFDCEEQQSRLESAKAELLGATETHLAKLKLQGLGAAGELEVTLAAAAVEKSRAGVRQVETQMTLCKIMAPYNGQVARLRTKPFESVSLGQPLMEIVAQGGLKAVMHVPAAWLEWIKPGTPVLVRLAETKLEHPGRVSKLNSRVDGVSQTLEIEAIIDTKNARVLPGMIGTASFPGQPR